MLRRGYSGRTIETYTYCIKHFMSYCRKDLNCVKKADIKEYIDRYVERSATGNTINVHLNALKFLFEEILQKKIMVKIRYSKTPKTFPVFLTKEEVFKLINSIENKKHKLMVELIYSSGLRVSELLNLKVCDLEFERNVGWVRHGKGNKDRPFIIAKCLEKDLKEHITRNCNSSGYYLFTSRQGQRLSVRTVQEIVKKAARNAGISKNIHPHSLRHSFATHIIENGYDVTTLQPLLGHSSAETTLRYVHMVNHVRIKVVSPYDLLKKDENSKNNKNVND